MKEMSFVRLEAVVRNPHTKPFLFGVLVGIMAHMAFTMFHDAARSGARPFAAGPVPAPIDAGPASAMGRGVPPVAPPPSSQGPVRIMVDPAPRTGDVSSAGRRYIDFLRRTQQRLDGLPPERRDADQTEALKMIDGLRGQLSSADLDNSELKKAEKETRDALKR
jgi:hypothetical protein